MKRALGKATETELRDEFIKICLEQENTDYDFEIEKNNQLYQKMAAVVDELKRRPGDGRHLLLPLFEHESLQVRLRAAKNAFALDPVGARRVLQWLRETRPDHYGMDAGTMLALIDAGYFTPA
ncbi:MAG: DUF2019 domain-containing protein [Pseudomonadota bacterium]